jgi:hypothetical protein
MLSKGGLQIKWTLMLAFNEKNIRSRDRVLHKRTKRKIQTLERNRAFDSLTYWYRIYQTFRNGKGLKWIWKSTERV